MITVIAALSRLIAVPFPLLVAEAVAVREGIRFVLTSGLRVERVETASLIVSKAINDVMSISVIDSVVSDIKSLLLEIGDGTCHFIPHSGNEVAHTLARESATFTGEKSWLYKLKCCPRS